MKVTRKKLAEMISEATGHGPYHVTQVVEVVFKEMRKALVEGNRIEIRGFGAFTVKDVKPNPSARNPMTGETIFVPAHRKVHFKPGLLIKEEIHKPLKKGEKIREV